MKKLSLGILATLSFIVPAFSNACVVKINPNDTIVVDESGSKKF